MRDEFVEEIEKIAQEDRDFMLLTGDLGFGIFDSFADRFPEQFLNVGVAEQNMVGIATGLALSGKKVVTYSIANFATLRCLEQIRNDAAYHEANVTVVASGGGFTYGSLGMSHHATEDLAIMRALPGVQVVAPTSPDDTRSAIRELVATKGVGYLRIEKGGKNYSSVDAGSFQLGKVKTIRQGTDVSICVTGGLTGEVMQLADLLAQQGIEARVECVHTLKPLDESGILESVKSTKALVVIEEHNRVGGLGSAICELLVRNNVRAPKFAHVGLPDEYSAIVGDQNYLRQRFGLDADSMFIKIQELIEG